MLWIYIYIYIYIYVRAYIYLWYLHKYIPKKFIKFLFAFLLFSLEYYTIKTDIIRCYLLANSEAYEIIVYKCILNCDYMYNLTFNYIIIYFHCEIEHEQRLLIYLRHMTKISMIYMKLKFFENYSCHSYSDINRHVSLTATPGIPTIYIYIYRRRYIMYNLTMKKSRFCTNIYLQRFLDF